MINSLSNESKVITEKILVGITAQNNSRRLIKKGFEVANAKNGQLHILHVQKGSNIFVNADTSQLLQELYQYGSELGGETHAICGDDICEAIIEFIKKASITRMVLGERIENFKIDNDNHIVNTIKETFPDIEIIILEREKKITKQRVKYEHKFA